MHTVANHFKRRRDGRDVPNRYHFNLNFKRRRRDVTVPNEILIDFKISNGAVAIMFQIDLKINFATSRRRREVLKRLRDVLKRSRDVFKTTS